MLYLSFHPGPPLNELVDHFWLIEGAQAPRLEKILPSGTNELVVNLKNNEIHIHDVASPNDTDGFPVRWYQERIHDRLSATLCSMKR